jgi:hypothetical protein
MGAPSPVRERALVHRTERRMNGVTVETGRMRVYRHVLA